MKLKKLISAACSAAMLTALVPAQTVSNAACLPPMETYISDINVVGATGMDDGSDVNAALKRLLINEGYLVTLREFMLLKKA